jgi:hypothetical protein
MNIKEMLKTYEKHCFGRWTFKTMYETRCEFGNQFTISYFPFLEDRIMRSDDGDCLLQQLVAMEMGLA